MDEELITYLLAMEARLVARLDMGQLNTKLDDILDKLSADRSDLDLTKGHVVYVMEDSLALSRRITKLEEEMRRMRDP